MTRIRPEDLPKPRKVTKKRAKELLDKFTASGTSKYDVYVNAARDLKPGEALDSIELPENVITGIQKKFRERGLTTGKGYYAKSRTLGTEKKGNKTLLIGRTEARAAAASPKASPKKKATSARAKAKSVPAKSTKRPSPAKRTAPGKKATPRRTPAKAPSQTTAQKAKKPVEKPVTSNGKVVTA